MRRVIREDYYFDEPGPENTEYVIESVKKRVELTGIKYVIIGSISGETAVKFAEALKDLSTVICVSGSPYRREWGLEWPCIKPEYRSKLESLGVIVVENVPYGFHNSVFEEANWSSSSPELLVKEIMYFFGQGLKVAVEVVLTAVSCGFIEPYQDVIGVGGTHSGADTAIIMKATYPASMFSKEPKKRLEIREIIAMPLHK